MPETVNQNESTETLPLQPEITVTNDKPLPSFCYCPTCGMNIFECGIGFNANISGSGYGAAYIDGNRIITEGDNDDYSYQDIDYLCRNCEDENNNENVEITNELDKTIELFDKIKAYCALNNIHNLNQDTQRVANVLNLRSTSEAFISVQTNNGYLISVTILANPGNQTNQTNHTIFHPKIYEFVKTLAEENEEYAFAFNHPFYEQAYTIFGQALNEYEERNRQANVGIDTSSLRMPVQNGFGRMPRFINPEEFLGIDEAYIEDDPMQSQTVERSHHRRWNDNDLSHICTCVHCMYSFECEPELNLVICPKCNKETENALNQ